LLDGYTKSNGQIVRTFLDSNCLLDGGNWEKNFLSALHNSTLIVLIISEAGLDLASPSHSGFSKIQKADKEQDNCLLEYEYALQLFEKKEADIFVLCVAKEANLGGIRCKVKFPSSPEGIAQRLAMYSETGHHQHRDGSKGPLVPETMGKLLGLITPPAKGAPPNFAHLDPDDAGGKITDILWRLEETESQFSLWKKAGRMWKDIASLKIKLIGLFCGMILPIICLLAILTVRNARHKALRFGIIIGHGIDCVVIAAYLFGRSFTAVPKDCGTYASCLDNVGYLAAKYRMISDGCFQDPPPQFNPCIVFSGQGDPTGCTDCFCGQWTYACSLNQNNQKVWMFMGILVLVIAVGLFFYANYLSLASEKRKNRSKV